MPVFEDVPFELKNYALPRTLAVGVADRRTGADTLLIRSGTVVLPPDVGRHGAAGSGGGGDGRIYRKRIRFALPQTPKVVTAAAQVRGMQAVAGVASFRHEGGGGDADGEQGQQGEVGEVDAQ